MYFKVKLADFVIGVECLYKSTMEFCGEYVIDCDCDNQFKENFIIKITLDDIESERLRSADSADCAYSNEYIETLVLQRKISAMLPAYDCFLMHGAVTAVNGAGYMFTATSGTGKSTHVGFWKKYFDDVEIINGDKPFIRVTGNEVRVYGTPWAGKEGWQVNKSVPLKSICFLKRGVDNNIQKINPVSILPFMMRQVHYTDDPQMAGKTMELFNRMLEVIDVYVLECDISKEAAECSYDGMVINAHMRRDD